MKPLSNGAQVLNIHQLSAFRSYWRDSREYPDENRGNNRVYLPVVVEYEIPTGGRRTVFETAFYAFVGAGPDDGTVDLEETDRISINDFHLRFLPAFQTYRFDDAEGTLIVTGISKTGKPYSVVIRPTIEEP
jgi:hypothetical protein